MICLSLTLRKKTLKPSKNHVSMPRMDEKKLHAREFQLKGRGGNMRCKLLWKRFFGKEQNVLNTSAILPLKKISQLNRCIFQISLKYFKLVIPKIHFILVLCSFNFYLKITWTPLLSLTKINPRLTPTIWTRHPSKEFSEIFTPSHPQPGGGVHALCLLHMYQRARLCWFSRKGHIAKHLLFLII